ncbi:MAG: hypothetical protein RBS68_12245 [Anaerolineales bacterium]|jgi:hypothetical protein|nr:hypothetical protein [Anaerolineales bacterium]
MLKEQKIILISDSRLVRSILKRAFQLSHQFQVVAEVADLAGFGTALDQAQAGWVLLAQPLQADIPEEINQALKDRPDVGLLVVATDSNRVQIWSETNQSPHLRGSLPGQWPGREPRFKRIRCGTSSCWADIFSCN